MPSTPSPRRIGEHLETVALHFLQRQGLTLLTRNFHCKVGEIDLVMRQQNTLVFVEVRYRRSARYGHPVETVDARKQRKLIRTAHVFLMRHVSLQEMSCRFDIVGIMPSEEPGRFALQWLDNAFGLPEGER